MAKKKKEELRDAFLTLAERLDFAPAEQALLRQALTHPAYFEGVRHEGEGDNQRLEFLGDAVLDILVGEYLYQIYPEAQEGDLSKMRAYIVCEASLADAAIALGVDQALRLGRGSEAGGDRQRPSVLADAYEAVTGAVFVAHGFEAAKDFLLSQFAEKMDTLSPEDYEDKKSLLQQLVQARVTYGVSYKLLEKSGVDHCPRFVSGVYCGKRFLGSGEGGSKKESEVAAAAEALAHKEDWLEALR